MIQKQLYLLFFLQFHHPLDSEVTILAQAITHFLGSSARALQFSTRETAISCLIPIPVRVFILHSWLHSAFPFPHEDVFQTSQSCLLVSIKMDLCFFVSAFQLFWTVDTIPVATLPDVVLVSLLHAIPWLYGGEIREKRIQRTKMIWWIRLRFSWYIDLF